MSIEKQILSEITFEVFADKLWQKTGIKITAAEKAVVNYQSGTWQISPSVRSCGPNGDSSYIAKPGYTMPLKPEGGLIGRIGTKVFWVGGRGETPDGYQGELELCANDDVEGRYGAGFGDNSGSLVLQIELMLR